MRIKLGVVMDPITSINRKKDTTLAMLWEAEARGYAIYYLEQKDLSLRNGVAYGDARTLKFKCEDIDWYELGKQERIKLSDLQVILMRKDPPFNEEYIYSTYILEQAQAHGSIVVNNPQALRDANEKIYATYFPECAPPSIVTQSIVELHAFWREHKDIVCKPLDTMGGASIFRLQPNDVNANVVFESLTKGGTKTIIAQRFIPEVVKGDKRILLIDGKPIHHALMRIPQGNDWRGNLAVGAKGEVQPLTSQDHLICEQIGPDLVKRGLIFVGIDVIGKYLTEINVTSPTCIREIDAGADTNIAGDLMDAIESKFVKSVA